MKKITKKLLVLVLTFAITFSFGIFFRYTKDTGDGFDDHPGLIKLNAFTNEQFNTTIPQASGTAAEEFVAFEDIHNIILTAMTTNSYADNAARDTDMVNKITTLVGSKRVAIYTAEDLYNFSIAASYNWREAATPNLYANLNTIDLIMSLDYALLNDIDYSVMKSKQFVPIGINFTHAEGSQYHPFTGTFDGNGFTISNLYFADYNYITMIHRMEDDKEGSTDTDIPLSQFYAMFANVGEGATICNFEIKNPIMELLDVPDGLYQTAVVAGENNGMIYNVSVVDEKTNSSGNDSSGISWHLQYGSVAMFTFEAAGLVHTNTNKGQLLNSYYFADRVVESSSAYLFHSKPVVYKEGGTISGVAYHSEIDSTVNALNTVGSGIEKYSEEDLLAGTNVNINDATINGDDNKWYFFKDDCLPTLKGLDYDSTKGAFVIENEYDLNVFSIIISRHTLFNGVAYASQNYIITNNIDMGNITYTPPKEDFKGTLSGGTSVLGANANTNSVIKNLKINNPYHTEMEMYYGLLSIVSGTIQNINFAYCKINLVQDSQYAFKKTYAGIVAGKTENATIINILSDASIDFGTEVIGQAYVGGIIGYGNGTITNVANLGEIKGNASHTFSGYTVNAIYQIGGILGGSSDTGLKLSNAVNKGKISSLGTNETFTASDKKIEISLGGIVGQLNNSTTTNNSVYYVTNEGIITANAFSGNATVKAYVYASGIIGNVIGKSGPLNSGETVLNGRYENKGTILNENNTANTISYNAGILVASTSVYSEFSYMINTANSNLNNELSMNSSNNNKQIYYAATVVDNSTAGITLSRSYNEADYVFDNNYFINNTNEALIGPFYTSVNNNKSKLLFCQNNGDITIKGTSTITTYSDTKIAGFTQSYNLEYENVYMTGNIQVLNVIQTADLYVSGIAWILPYLDTVNTAKNMLNEGSIITAGIGGTTTVSNVSGTAQTSSSFSATIDANNLYVAGLFNLNVGEITNSINRADISSELSGYNQITGTCNTFVGGLVTYNYNLIQDCANSGNINYTNEVTTLPSSGYMTYVAGGNDPNCHFGGLVFAYSSGLSLGGICSALGDRTATILLDENVNYGNISDTTITSTAKIYDSSNNGNIYGKALEYVRTGGILAVALGVEITAGNDTTNSSTSSAKRFSWCEVGANDKIATAELSNGLNFGNVCAITNKIGQYSGTNSTSYSNDHRYNNAKRPGVYSCSGGVIGYGLCKMIRMINHGVISSCDVAGGVVGGTYVLGTQNTSNGYSVTTVDINTAVHYGKVKAVKQTAYSSFTSSINMYINSYISNTSYFYNDGDTTFIFPISGSLTFDNLSLYPNKKRGFGGIFGRLQRGNSGVMQSETFINILNMDENVDMVGRADGTSYGAYYYYKLFVRGKEDTYYSARINDSSPALVVGYVTSKTENINISSSSKIVYTIYRRQRNNGNYYYYVTALEAIDATGTYTDTISRRVSYYTENASNNPNVYTNVTQSKVTGSFSGENLNLETGVNTTSNTQNINNFGFTNNQIQDIQSNNGWSNNYKYYEVENVSNITSQISTNNNVSSYRMEIVTDNPSETDYTYIFDEDFPLMDPEQSNYIYAADNPVLADRFRESDSTNYKPNGMYVLASTKGRDKGAVLPANLKVNSLYKLNENEDRYIDLTNIKTDDLLHLESENTDILNDYRSMFQIRLSDKSMIMEQSEDATLYDLVLYDKSGNAPTLMNGVIGTDTNGNPTITFTISGSAFNLSNGSSAVNYNALSAELSENAVIAKSDLTDVDSAAFLTAYNNRTSNIMSGSYESTLSGTVTSGQTVTLPNKITVYSEIACNVESLITTYKTDYTVIINCVATALTINLTTSQMDGNTVANPALNGTTYNFGTTNTIAPNGTLDLTFTDVNNVLPEGHEITFVDLKFGTTSIDPKYYSYTLSGADVIGNNLLSIGITLSDELKAGAYTLEYKYYSNKDTYYVIFNKASSGQVSVLDTYYNSYSFDANNSSLEFIEQTGDFYTYIGFGVLLSGVKYNISSDLVVKTITSNYETYVDNVDCYEMYLNDVLINTIELSPFATLSSATVLYKYDANGNREHEFTYSITSETGVVSTITHTIKERALEDIIIYKDGVIQSAQPIMIKRESALTKVSIDFGFSDANENANVYTEITGNVNTIDKSMVYYSHAVYYVVNITDKLETGELTYTFSLQRETDVNKELTSIKIKKSLGTNAYLLDINFQAGSDTVLSYPSIYEADENGKEVTSIYDIRAYYAGIDYDGADEVGKTIFRIDGKVADIDLSNYHPTFTIPVGASIERKNGDSWSTDLYADFIGEEDQDECVIQYRITSEDKSSVVYYHITATDILYNLTLRFTIYYRDANGNISVAEESAIKDRVIIISVRNYALTGNVEDYKNVTDADNHVTYPYEPTDSNPTGISGYISGVNNHTTMFYKPVAYSDYLYTFGRNFSGCYGFSVVTPIYEGATMNNLVNGERYSYEIYIMGIEGTESNLYPWATEKYILPNLDNTGVYDGKYFYIENSLRNRIRSFAIVIDEKTGSGDWGLTDEDTTWN